MLRARHILFSLVIAAIFPALFYLVFVPRPAKTYSYKLPPPQPGEPIETGGSPLRKRLWLDGEWLFRLSGEKDWRGPVTVPGVWNTVPGLEDYAGEAEYRKQFTVPVEWNKERVVLLLQGVAWRADVSVNGQKAASIESGAFTRELDITDSLNFGGKNLLDMSVSNALAPGAPAPQGSAIKNFGGIFREVALESRAATRIESIRVRAAEVSDSEASVSVRVTLTSTSDSGGRLMGEIDSPQGWKVKEINQDLSLNAGELQTFEWNVSIPVPERWWPHAPAQYTARMFFMTPGLEAVDGMAAPFGIRQFGISGGQFVLNGQNIYLRGVDRIPADGPALVPVDTLKDITGDIGLARAAGFNTIRIPYFLPAPAFLDQCDGAGMLVLEELPLYGLSASGPEAKKRAREMIKDMIARDANHPSVIMWGLGQGADMESTPVAALVRELADYARTLDPTRPVYIVPREGAAIAAPGSPAAANIALRSPGAALDELVAGAAGSAAVAFGIKSPGRAGFTAGAGRAGTEQDQLENLARLRLLVDSRPDLDGDFVHSLQDYAAPTLIPGMPQISYTGLLDSARSPKPSFEWLSKYDPGKNPALPVADRATLPAAPPTLETLLAVLFALISFAFWASRGRARHMLLSPNEASPAVYLRTVFPGGKPALAMQIEAENPDTPWPLNMLSLGLPAIIFSTLAVASAIGGAADRLGWSIAPPQWGGPWPAILAVSAPARIVFALAAQVSLILLTGAITGLFLKRNPLACAELLSRCLTPRLLWAALPLIPINPLPFLALLLLCELALRARALGEATYMKPLPAWLIALAAPAITAALAAGIIIYAAGAAARIAF